MNIVKAFWQKWWWGTLILFPIGLIILVTTNSIVISPNTQKNFKEGVKKGEEVTSVNPSPSPSSTPVPTVEATTPTPTEKPTLALTPTPTPTPVPTTVFDTSLGNNYVAAKYAQQFQDIADKIAAGVVQDIYLELVPEDMKGKSEDEYKKNLVSAFLTVIFSNSFWNSLDDPTRKDLVAAYVNAVKNTFGGFPHVKFSNGVRTVAEGEWSVWNGEPKVTLK